MSSAEAKLGEFVDGKYELDALLGQGGMGAVYRARHAITGRRVAIKWLLENDESRRRRFLREARAMGRLEHPNVVQVFDVAEHEGEIYLVMEHLQGGSLRDFILEEGMSPAAAIKLVMPALQGVVAAHQAGILHRDLKPENLFVCCERDGTPYDTKVLDFGLAKAVEAEADSKLTHSGAIVGTPRYMSPEQLEEKSIDAGTDIYALGLILYECLVGNLPYRSHSLNALLLEILTADHTPPHIIDDSIPEGLSMAVKKAVERHTDDRFEDVAAFARAIEPYGETPFKMPREVGGNSEHAGLTPSLDDERISSSIRMRPSSPESTGPFRAQADIETHPGKKQHSQEAYAATTSLSSAEVTGASMAVEVTPPAKRNWIIPAAVAGVLLVAGAVLAATMLGRSGADAPVEAGLNAAEVGAVAAEAAAAARAEVEAEAEARAAAVAEAEEQARAAAVAEAEAAAVETTRAQAEAESEAEARAEAEAEARAEAQAAETTSRGRRRRSRQTQAQAPPPTPTPTPTPRENGSGLRVNSRAGVLRSDDF